MVVLEVVPGAKGVPPLQAKAPPLGFPWDTSGEGDQEREEVTHTCSAWGVLLPWGWVLLVLEAPQEQEEAHPVLEEWEEEPETHPLARPELGVEGAEPLLAAPPWASMADEQWEKAPADCGRNRLPYLQE